MNVHEAVATDTFVPEYKSPEKRLMLAVLEDAWICAIGLSGALREQEDARKWIASDDRGTFAFVDICAVGHFDPHAIRRQLADTRSRIGMRQDQRRCRMHGQEVIHVTIGGKAA